MTLNCQAKVQVRSPFSKPSPALNLKKSKPWALTEHCRAIHAIIYFASKCNKSAIYNPLNLLAIHSNIWQILSSFYIICVGSTSNMEEEKKNAGKYLSEILENDDNKGVIIKESVETRP